VTAAPALLAALSIPILGLLTYLDHRRQQRATAHRAERAARPHSVHVGTAAQDAAAITRAALDEALR
jgi:hypothetical protein